MHPIPEITYQIARMSNIFRNCLKLRQPVWRYGTWT